MTVSVRVMSARDGYKYSLRTVAASDGVRSLSTPLTRYYNAEGTPPGRRLGGGVATLGGGRISVGDQVSEAQLQLLVGMGREPYHRRCARPRLPKYRSVSERVVERTRGTRSSSRAGITLRGRRRHGGGGGGPRDAAGGGGV